MGKNSSPASAQRASLGRGPEYLGRYRVVKRIATGGMAEIYLACAAGLEGCDRPVVIKRMLPRMAADIESVHMFLDEARVISKLSHPNIVDFYEVESREDEYFIAMEFLHGADVLRVLKACIARERPIPLEAALTIGAGVCAGLHYAHEKTGRDGRSLGIVHRDISPQNVFVTFDGGVKLLDFGVAKTALRSSKTRHGVIKGKISYLSPEQGRAEELDRRSDIFSLSILLWEMTTRTKLYRGDSDYAVLRSILESEPPLPSSVCPGYPPELERIVMRGLRKEKNERYQTVEQLQVDLEQFALEHKVSISPRSATTLMKELFGEELSDWDLEDEDHSGRVSPDAIARLGGPRWLHEDEPAERDATPPSNPMTATTMALRRRPPKWLSRALPAGVLCAALASMVWWTLRDEERAPPPVTRPRIERVPIVEPITAPPVRVNETLPAPANETASRAATATTPPASEAARTPVVEMAPLPIVEAERAVAVEAAPVAAPAAPAPDPVPSSSARPAVRKHKRQSPSNKMEDDDAPLPP